MQITSTSLQLASSSTSRQQHDLQESLKVTLGQARPLVEAGAMSVPATSEVQVSDAGRAAQSNEAQAIDDSLESVDRDPMLRLIRAMVAILTGREVRVFDARELSRQGTGEALPASPGQPKQQVASARPTAQDTGVAVEYQRHESYSELEQSSFQASGVVRTAAGEEISFSIALEMSRSYHEESNASIQLGDSGPKKDPLVLNFGGSAAQLTSQRFRFDLDGDGRQESVSFVGGGSGFLAIDRNGDGKVNSGLELFGVRSGNGFAELAALDSDHNGWIDSADAAFETLRLWTRNSAGDDQLVRLSEAGIGALSVTGIDSPFSLRNGSNELQGQIRSSGVFLYEDGRAGSIQQVDLTV